MYLQSNAYINIFFLVIPKIIETFNKENLLICSNFGLYTGYFLKNIDTAGF